MSRRLVLLVLFLVLVVGALFFFNSQVEPVEPSVMEEPVELQSDEPADGDA